MTNMDAPGGGPDEYWKLPKGNLDVTGQYFIWTSNLGGNRLDAFIVHVPVNLLPPAIDPGFTAAGAALPTTTSPPPPSGSSSSCSTPDPFVAIGGGTCVNGGWLPPGMVAPSTTSP